MFFVDTAPSGEGEVHISPKGYDILKIIDENNVIYLDYYGSENETAKDLTENGKISLMWCSFDAKPCILRAYGKGEVIHKGTDEFSHLLKQYFENYNEKMVRQLFKVKIHRVMTTCGF
jgi:predicted metal-binding transcription factor (methanogenesis marker protein 9)